MGWVAIVGFGVAGLSVLGFGARRSWMLELLCHFRLQYTVILVLVSLSQAIAREWRRVGILLPFALLNAVTLVPFYSGVREAWRGGSGQDVRLLLANVHSGNHAHGRLLELIYSSRPDVVALLEITPEWQEALSVLAEEYPYSEVQARTDNFGVALYSRIPVTNAFTEEIGRAGLPSIVARFGGRQFPATLVVTHPPPPIGGRLSADRNHQLRQLMMFRRESAGPVCIAGDLNVTPWSPAFARMRQGAGLVDSLRGRGVQPTWPTWFPLAGIPIDHFLHTPEVTVTRRETGPRIGSDHLPILVDFTWQLSE